VSGEGKVRTPVATIDGLDDGLRRRLAELFEEGWEIFDKFSTDVRDHEFHPFVPADYGYVLASLLPLAQPGRRFMEWGSATGVITIAADMLGFEAYGIELDADLVDTARHLAQKYHSKARFAAASFLPAGYVWRPTVGDGRLGTIGDGPSGYLELGHALDEFDVVFGYPWGGEEGMMLDLMTRYGRKDAVLLLNKVVGGHRVYIDGRLGGES